jgi:uncharacterized repeat protein (TIGR01451 family)
LILLLALAALVAAAGPAAAAPGTPGAPQAPTVAYDEPFENGVGATPILLSAYTGADGTTYGADAPWLVGCNGAVLEFASPDGAQGASGCSAAVDYDNVRQMAWALGSFRGAPSPALNHAVTAYTENGPGVDRIQFETVSPIALPPTNGRYLTFSVDATETNCFASHAQFKFYLVDGATEIPTFTTPIDPCADPGSVTITAPAVGTLGAKDFRTGSYAGNRAVLFSGSALGIRMRNGQGSGSGNDAAFDNIRVLDATPQLDKAFSATDRNLGQATRLTFTITNTSELAAKPGWSFADTLPAGLVVADPADVATTCVNGAVTAPAGGGAIGVTGDLDAGQASCTVSVDVTATRAGTFANGPGNVTTTGLNPPGDATVTYHAADVSVAKQAAATPAVSGADLTYNLVVANHGPDAAPNTVVSDTLPAGLTYLSSSPECTASGQTVTCAAGTLASGASRTFQVTATVAPDLAAGTLANTATAGSDLPDPDPSNNNSTATVPVEPRADVAIVKRALSDKVVPGRTIKYQLIVTNHGPSVAKGVTATDPLPKGLTFVSASDGCSEKSGTVTCAPGTMAPDATVTYTVTAKAASSVSDRVVNTAKVTSDTKDPDPDDNESTGDVPPDPEADLSIDKTPSVQAVHVGQQMFYTLVVRNDGPSDARNVVVGDDAATGLTLVSAKASQGTCAVAGGTVTCKLGTLGADGAAQVLVSARADAVGTLLDEATVGSDTKDPDPEDNDDEVKVPSSPAPVPDPADLEVVKTADHATVTGAGAITYTLVVTNRGPGASPGTTVTDTPSLPVKVSSIRTTAGTCRTATPVTCELGTLAPGAKVTITVVARPLAAGTLRNSASVTGDAPDPKTDNNLDGAATGVRGVLRISKVAGASTVVAGGTLSYRIRVTNASPFAVDAVKVCDDLPSGLVYVSSSPRARLTSGRYCWTIATLGARKARTLTIRVRVLRGASGRKVNVATATSPQARGARTRAATDTAVVHVKGVSVRGGGVTG